MTSTFVGPAVRCCSRVPPRCPYPDSERPGWTKQPCRFVLEHVFDNLVRWGLGTTWTWAGRSQRHWSGARSCLASTSPPSASWPPRSSRISAPTALGSGASCSLSGSSGPRRTAGAAAVTSTADGSRLAMPNHSGRRRCGMWAVKCYGPSVKLSSDLLHAIYGPAARSRPITADKLSVWLSVGHRG
jgi:hypothetical protein